MSKVGQAILPAAAFQAARRLKAGGSQDWLPHSLTLLLMLAASASAADFPATNYGAKGDGQSVDTIAIQKAIDAAAAAKPAGTVVFKPGVYLSGSLFLKSGVQMRLDDGVEIRGVHDLSAYPVMPTRVAGIEMKWPAALINVYQQANVQIFGKGTIDGDGKVFWDKYWQMRREYEPKGLRWAVDYDCQRPRLIQIYKSSNVHLQGLTLKRSGFWTVHICYSQDVNVEGTIIRNNIPGAGGKGPSTDGIDIDSSANVIAEDNDIECNDDAICLKAGRDADGLRVNRPSEQIRIRNNTVRGGAAGVTIGSETSGGIRDVEVDRLTVLPGVPAGILFKSANTRGGTVQNIRIRNVEMRGVPRPISITMNWNPSYSYAKLPDGVKQVPDYWRVLLAPVSPEKGLPHFRDVHISYVHATGAQQAFTVSAYPEAPLQDFEFKDIYIEAKTAGSIRDAQNWSFAGATIKTLDGSRVTVKDSSGVTGLESHQ
jgi:polygalacturonase